MYNISSASTLLLLLAILFITVQACSGTEPIISPDSERDNFYQPERPLPYPIDIPVDYLYAIQEGSRSMDGAPGDYYWQNEASYDLKAELLPEENKINGHVKIQYQNNSPDQLRQLLLELAQNLHKAGTMKKDNTEITGGVDLRSVKVRGRELNEFDPEIRGYGGDPGYLVDATRLLIVLDETLNPGDSIDLEIEWSFVVPQEGAGGRMGRSRDNLFFYSVLVSSYGRL